MEEDRSSIVSGSSWIVWPAGWNAEAWDTARDILAAAAAVGEEEKASREEVATEEAMWLVS